MGENAKISTRKLALSRVSWRVYVTDKIANVVIRVGGLTVIFAVLGLVAFIFTQVLPLFESPRHGAIDAPSSALDGRTLLLHSDEYRRVGLRITDDGRVQSFAVNTGAVIETITAPNLGSAKVTAAHITSRPYARGLIEGVNDAPRYAFTLGLSDGRALGGNISYLCGYKRYELGSDPKELSKLRMPEKSEFERSDYVPDLAVADDGGKKWLVEHLAEFGFYRRLRALIAFDHDIDLGSGGEAIESINTAVSKGELEAEHEYLTGAITAKGRALLAREKSAFNTMTEELEFESLGKFDVSPQIKGRARFVICHDLLKEAVFASDDGKVCLLRQGEKDNRFAPAYEAIDVFHGDWASRVAELRSDAGLPVAGGPLKLTAMSYLLGDVTVLFGDSHGGVQSWFPVRATPEDPNPQLTRVRALEPSAAAIAGFSPAQTSKLFAVWDNQGSIRCIHNTSERVVMEDAASSPQTVFFGSRGDGVVAIDESRRVRHWWLENKHGEISFKSLFGSVWYEGYPEPKAEWQTSSGTDDTEAKYSLIPLIAGTLKGGLYALLFAMPIAVLGAIYTSEFMHRSIRAAVKPAVEVMASLPSVVLGFLAALYVAPNVEAIMPSLIVMAVLCPALFMLFGWMWQQLPPTFTGKFGPRATLALLLLILVGGVSLSMIIGPRLEDFLFPAAEGADPALLDARTFAPIDDAAAKRLSAGDFRSWTDGGRILPRPTQVRLTTLPQGWWIPGGHNLFIALMVIPFALLAGWLIRNFSAVLFGGRGFFVDREGFFPGNNPMEKIRHALAGNKVNLRAVAVDLSFSLLTAGVVVLVGIGFSMLISPGIEAVLFSYDHPTAGSVADFRRFVTGEEGWRFNQRNSLIVGFAMGFAVIPIIYSIAEDALSAVPNQLRAASLACGASRWQTAVNVVVPAAASGIFSAIVIGLGRALGETMIVVMAAGGTPVMTFEPLSGFRSLSASIAIEMPEAPKDSTHYRTLFLCGLLLFAMTFVISTLAEFVRMRLRKKLSRM